MKPWTVIGVLLLIGLTGCLGPWQKRATIQTFMLETQRSGDPVAEPLGARLWIRPVSVLPPYDVRNLVVRSSDVGFEESYYAELLLSPADNVRNAAYFWLADSNLFEDIPLSDRAGATHTLAIAVTHLYSMPDAGEAVVGLRATLLDEKADVAPVQFSNGWIERVKLEQTDPESVIRAYNRGLEKILIQLETEMTEALR